MVSFYLILSKSIFKNVFLINDVWPTPKKILDYPKIVRKKIRFGSDYPFIGKNSNKKIMEQHLFYSKKLF